MDKWLATWETVEVDNTLPGREGGKYATISGASPFCRFSYTVPTCDEQPCRNQPHGDRHTRVISIMINTAAATAAGENVAETDKNRAGKRGFHALLLFRATEHHMGKANHRPVNDQRGDHQRHQQSGMRDSGAVQLSYRTTPSRRGNQNGAHRHAAFVDAVQQRWAHFPAGPDRTAYGCCSKRSQL